MTKIVGNRQMRKRLHVWGAQIYELLLHVNVCLVFPVPAVMKSCHLSQGESSTCASLAAMRRGCCTESPAAGLGSRLFVIQQSNAADNRRQGRVELVRLFCTLEESRAVWINAARIISQILRQCGSRNCWPICLSRALCFPSLSQMWPKDSYLWADK